MTSIALGVFITFIIYIMIWSIKNDGARSISEQTGLIRMRDPSTAPRKSGGRSEPRRTSTAAANGRANKDR
jgi:hypothetical protein